MNDEDKIKPAEIQDQDLNEAQGGARYFTQTSGFRPVNVKLDPVGLTIDAQGTFDNLSGDLDGEDMILRKRPGR